MALEPPLWAAGPDGSEYQHSALLDRRLLDAIYATGGGVVESGALRAKQRAVGANMSVDIASGMCIIPGTSISDQGKYLCRSTAAENRAIATAPPSGTRTDLLIARVADSEASGVSDGFILEVLTGTTTIPDDAIGLAHISVSSGTAAITDAMITDIRDQASIRADLLEGASLSSPTSNSNIATKGYVDNKVETDVDEATAGVWSVLSSGTTANNNFNVTVPAGLTGDYIELILRGDLVGAGEIGVSINTAEGGGNLGYEWVYTTFAANSAQSTYQDDNDTTVIVSRWSTISNIASVRIYFHNTPNTYSTVPFRFETRGSRHSSSSNLRWTTIGSGRALTTGTASSLYVAARGADVAQVWWQLCGFKA